MTDQPPPDPTDEDTAVRPVVASSRQPRRRRPGRVVLAVLGILAALVAVLYGLAYLVAGDRLPRGAVVSGIAIGGRTPAEAEDTLVESFEPRLSTPVPVSAGGKAANVLPAEAGLGIDYARSVAAAGGGRSLDPRSVLAVLTGGTATEAVLLVEEDALAGAMERVAGEVDAKPVNAGLVRRGARFVTTKARDGVVLEQQGAASTFADSFLTATGPVELPVEQQAAEVTTEEAEQVRTGYARQAVADPVRVRAGAAGRFSLTPGMIARGLSFVPAGGTLEPRLDPAALRKAARPALAEVELSKPRDARVRLVDGRPRVVAAVDGTSVGAKALAAAVEPALTRRGRDRTAEVDLDGAKADFSTADAKALGIREVTGEFTTRFPYAEYRNVNISRAAELINGTVLKPGETFSLNRIVGERTRANGFTEGLIISGGKFKRELGGGVSQSATTTYNAMFFAGLKDVEHQPHTLYIDRYPPGREATVAWPNLDLKFTNDTKYGVLVQASVTRASNARQGSITVRMWSTKTYDKITSTTPAKSNFTSGRDIVDDSASCEAQAPAQGFDVDYSRLFYRDGQVVRRQAFSWRYAPTDRIRCG